MEAIPQRPSQRFFGGNRKYGCFHNQAIFESIPIATFELLLA
jgi:hypothetical protein